MRLGCGLDNANKRCAPGTSGLACFLQFTPGYIKFRLRIGQAGIGGAQSAGD
jgi:hypothetical protein